VHRFEQVDDGSGVRPCDIFGGTPNNTVYQLKRERNVRSTGLTAMLLYAIRDGRNMTLDELTEAYEIWRFEIKNSKGNARGA
jgi:mannose/fructose-specific phosphotransferase system component IIA